MPKKSLEEQAQDMASKRAIAKADKKIKESFSAKLAELVEAYGIQGPAVVPSQIMDLAEDLSGESHSNVYALVVAVGHEIQKLWIAYGEKPNVLIDAKIKNALLSFGRVSPEFAILFLQTIATQHRVGIKNVDIISEYHELMGSLSK